MVRVIDGAEHLEPGLREERERLLDSGREFPTVRLACRLLVSDSATVQKRGVRPATRTTPRPEEIT
jgi:hypothetical protein